MSEFKVEVVKIGKIDKHPNADSLSITEIQGCPVIFRTGDFKEGGTAAYVPIDSMVPVARKEFAFLTNKDKPREFERIKAKRLRNIFSMGMLVPVPERHRLFWGLMRNPYAFNIGSDVASTLGVKKFEEEEDENTKGAFESFYRKWKWKLFGGTKYRGKVSGPKTSGPFPYYDLESARRYGNLFVEGEEVVITEKIHGQNARFGWADGKYLIASHGTYKQEDDESPSNNWSALSRKLGLKTLLEPYQDTVIYGEVYGVNANGKGIQHLTYGEKGTSFRVFDVFDLKTRRWYNHNELVMFATTILGLKTVPVLYRGPWLGLEAHAPLAEGKSTLANHIREGWVARPTCGRDAEHFGRLVLKYVGQGYLLDSKRTEKH